MIRVYVVLLLGVALAAFGLGGGAAVADGLSGTFGVDAAFVPGFTTDLWLDLDWSMDGWSVGNFAQLAVFPGFGASWTGTVEYAFAPFDVGAILAIDLYPFAFGGLDVYGDVALFDVVQGDFSASADAGLFSEILPGFGVTASLGLDAAYGVFSAWADVDFDILGLDVTVLVGGEVRVLDLDLENGSLTADLGGSTSVVPLDDGRFWLDLALGLGAVTVTAETEFVVVPFGLAQQSVEVAMSFDGVSVYAWGSFTGDGDVSAGIGGTYSFP